MLRRGSAGSNTAADHTALTGAANGFMSLIIVRFLFGMGEAGAYPNSTGTICRWFPKSETSLGIALFSMGSSAGAGIAPLIVVPIAIAFGWRAPFFVNALLGLCWVVVCYRWFRNHPNEMPQSVRRKRTLSKLTGDSFLIIRVFPGRRFSEDQCFYYWLLAAHFFQPPIVTNSFASCVELGGDRAGTIAGIMNFVGQTGAFLMSIFFGRIVDLSGSFDAPQFLMVGVLLAGALLWSRVDVTKRINS